MQYRKLPNHMLIISPIPYLDKLQLEAHINEYY